MWVRAWNVQGREEACVSRARGGRRESVVGLRPKSNGPVFRYITNVEEAIVGITEITSSDLEASGESKCLNRATPTFIF